VSPIFEVVQREGGVDVAEMYRVFNMGVGFCIVVAPGDVDETLAAVKRGGSEGVVAGAVVPGPRRIELPGVGLVGQSGRFARTR